MTLTFDETFFFKGKWIIGTSAVPTL